MKKIIRLIIVVLLVFPFIVRADMGAPVMAEYDAIVIKENGADVYEYSTEYQVTGHVDKGTKIKIIWEESSDGYAVFSEGEFGWKYIKTNAIAPVKEEVLPSDLPYSHAATGIQLYINDPNGVDIRKGPADAYGVVGHIDYGVTIKPEYYDDDEGRHYYVNYNGVKGWIGTFEDKVVYVNDEYYFLRTDLKLNTETIPKLSVVKPKYCTDVWGFDNQRHLCEFEYKKDKKYVSVFKDEDVIEIGELSDELEQVKFKKDLTIKASDNTANKEISIKKGDIYTLIDSSEDMETSTVDGDEYSRIVLYKDGVFISYLGKDGFDDNTDHFERTGKKIKVGDIINAEQSEEPTTTTTTAVGTTVVEKKEEKSYSIKDIIIVSSIVGGVVALTAIVVIVLINKKNKKIDETVSVETTVKPTPQPVESFVPTETIAPVEPNVEQTTNEAPVEPAVEDKKEE